MLRCPSSNIGEGWDAELPHPAMLELVEGHELPHGYPSDLT